MQNYKFPVGYAKWTDRVSAFGRETGWGGYVKISETSLYTGLCGCSMEQPYRANMLIVKSVGMLHGASADYASLSMNEQYIKNSGCINF